jgi:hypothetical protein
MTTVTHAMCATEPRTGRSKARIVTDTLSRSHFTTVATAYISSASPMNTAVLAMNSLSVACMRCGRARTVRVAHKPAKVETVIVRNFSPALPRLVQCDDVVEVLPSGVSQQVRLLYSTPAKSGRSSLGLQRFDRNSSRSRDSIHVLSARRNNAEQQKKCRYCYGQRFHN